MRRGKCMLRWFFVFWAAPVAVALVTSPALGMSSLGAVTEWPEGWPEELQFFVGRAMQGHFFGGVQEEKSYYIPCNEPEQFDAVWQALLKLKSPGAPLRLRRPLGAGSSVNAALQGPMVQVVCPSQGEYEALPDGAYAHKAPWSAQLEKAGRDLPNSSCSGRAMAPGCRWRTSPGLCLSISGSSSAPEPISSFILMAG